MRPFLTLLIFQVLMLFCGIAFAQPPVITNDVHVLQNSSPSQCPANWKGSAGPDIAETVSGHGDNDELTSPIIRSCDNCAYDSKSTDCVCKTCYDDYLG